MTSRSTMLAALALLSGCNAKSTAPSKPVETLADTPTQRAATRTALVAQQVRRQAGHRALPPGVAEFVVRNGRSRQQRELAAGNGADFGGRMADLTFQRRVAEASARQRSARERDAAATER